MKISLISIGPRRGRKKREGEDVLVTEYLRRAGRYCEITGAWVESEADFWEAMDVAPGRVRGKVILMDGGGRLLTSEEFAQVMGGYRDGAAQHVVVGIGGADGWTAGSKARADVVVSMGRLTLPHSLARVVAAEQIYRAMTVLAGHPYHCGH